MKKHLILIFLLLSFSNLQAQNTDSFHYKRNLLYFELYGPGVTRSINYERLFNLKGHLKLIAGIGYSNFPENINNFFITTHIVKLGLYYAKRNFLFGIGGVIEHADLGYRVITYVLNDQNFAFPYLALKYYHSSGIYIGIEAAINSEKYGSDPFTYTMRNYSSIKFYGDVDRDRRALVITPGVDIGYAFNFTLRVKHADSFPYYRKNLIYFELYGPGIMPSINYERLFNLTKHVKLTSGIGFSYYWDSSFHWLHGDVSVKSIPIKLGVLYFPKKFAFGGGMVVEPANIRDAIYTLNDKKVSENNNYTFIFPYLSLRYYDQSGIYVGVEGAINHYKYHGKSFPDVLYDHTDIHFYNAGGVTIARLTITPGLDIGYVF